jgi:hypothetical protein
MPQTVVGQFRTRGEAESALRKLEHAGLTSSDISIVIPGRSREGKVDAIGDSFPCWESLASNGRALPPKAPELASFGCPHQPRNHRPGSDAEHRSDRHVARKVVAEMHTRDADQSRQRKG